MLMTQKDEKPASKDLQPAIWLEKLQKTSVDYALILLKRKTGEIFFQNFSINKIFSFIYLILRLQSRLEQNQPPKFKFSFRGIRPLEFKTVNFR